MRHIYFTMRHIFSTVQVPPDGEAGGDRPREGKSETDSSTDKVLLPKANLLIPGRSVLNHEGISKT